MTRVLSCFSVLLIYVDVLECSLEGKNVSTCFLNALFWFKLKYDTHPTWNWQYFLFVEKVLTFLCVIFQRGAWALKLIIWQGLIVLQIFHLLDDDTLVYWFFYLNILIYYLYMKSLVNLINFYWKFSFVYDIDNLFLLSIFCWTTYEVNASFFWWTISSDDASLFLSFS